MHKFQLSWLLPLFMPFLLSIKILALCWFTGVDPDEITRGMIVFLCAGMGVPFGCALAVHLHEIGYDTSFRALFPKETPNE